jgi:hypothetical protein
LLFALHTRYLSFLFLMCVSVTILCVYLYVCVLWIVGHRLTPLLS